MRGAASPWHEIDPIPNFPVQLCEYNCFDTLRLSANISHGPSLLQTSHPSPYMVVLHVGEWKEGGAKLMLPEYGVVVPTFSQGEMMVLRGGLMVAIIQFEGERYQLELYLPEIPGMWKNVDEVSVTKSGEKPAQDETKGNTASATGTKSDKTVA